MKRHFVLLITVCLVFSLVSCGSEKGPETAGTENTVPDTTAAPAPVGAMPDDFSFYVVWGVHGISSYYSDTGKLTKTTDTIDGNKDTFVASLMLDEETTERFYELISSLDLLSYPSEYDPGCGYSDPCANLVLSYTANGKTYTVKCYNISVDYRRSDNEKGQAFLDVINEITDYLVSTPEWKALPDYEMLYD